MIDPLVCSVFVNDFIYIIEQSELRNFADNNTIISCGNSFEVVAPSLEEDMPRSKSWIKTNEMVVNASKLQVKFFGLNSKENRVLEIGGCFIDVASIIHPLGVTNDSKLKLNQHVSKICQK